ncbi:pectinesterase inhibitor-like [Rhododendron vialii]|uniref:pectinesterase inhibitor-like n=1 Tax=Rhododendron vialii TaxID=182163 RepID=UPI00265EDF67|nr:pectinesterase inhibitor-like [Rhododendron vialii]
MAAYSLNSFSSLFFLLPLFLSIGLSTSDLISEVCSKTQNPSLCLQALRSDRRSARADLKGLALISIDIAESNAKQTANQLIPALSKRATSPELRGRYDTCAKNYKDTIDNLNKARTALNARDIRTFFAMASAALDGLDNCEDSFEGPPAEPKQLRDANNKLKGLCSIILAIGARLGYGGLN